MAFKDNATDPHSTEKTRLPFPIGTKCTTPYGGAVILDKSIESTGSDFHVEFHNKQGEIIGALLRPLDQENKPFCIDVETISTRMNPSVFGDQNIIDEMPDFEDKTAETFQELVRIGALMLGYDPQKHTWEIEFETGADPSPLTDVVLFTYAAETMLGKSRQFDPNSNSPRPAQG